MSTEAADIAYNMEANQSKSSRGWLEQGPPEPSSGALWLPSPEHAMCNNNRQALGASTVVLVSECLVCVSDSDGACSMKCMLC